MKFQRLDLIVRVKDAIGARQAAAADRNAKAAAEYEEQLAKYLGDTYDAWKQLADTIRLRLRTGKPITNTDIPRELKGGWSAGHVETWNTKAPEPRTADTTVLEQLLVLLEAATDDEVTVHALERLGFRTAQLFTR